jgi:hypothetical protein
MRALIFVTLISALALAALPAGADTLQMSSPGNATPHAKRPVHGMTMQNVLHIFGEPLRKHPAVGNPPHPPITRWDYPGFVVIFEKNIVLRSVDDKKPISRKPIIPPGVHVETGGNGG